MRDTNLEAGTENITNEKVTDYLNSLYHPLSDALDELRKAAEEENIPILLKDAESLILQLIRLKRPQRILEIGTAIGYSAICFAAVAEHAEITSLEISEKMYHRACENVKHFGYGDRIHLRLGDGADELTTIRSEIHGTEKEGYDLVFIDAAKSHYQSFWTKALSLCKPGAMLIADNVLLKARTASDEYITDRRQKTSVRRMRDFLSFISDSDLVDTAVLPVGDGVAISIQRG